MTECPFRNALLASSNTGQGAATWILTLLKKDIFLDLNRVDLLSGEKSG